jgi:hypothetical protein
VAGVNGTTSLNGSSLSAPVTSLDSGEVVGVVRFDPSTHVGPRTSGTAVVQLTPTSLGAAPAVGFDVEGLASGVHLHFRCSCEALDGALGPVAPASPASVRLQSPVLLSVMVPGDALPTRGGGVISVHGQQLGAPGSLVTLLLSRRWRVGEDPSVVGSSSAGHDDALILASGACTIVQATAHVQCPSPSGVGAGYAVSLVVDGTRSDVWANGTLSFEEPRILTLTMLADDPQVGGGTSGGTVVVIAGTGFPSVEDSAVALGPVLYSPVRLDLQFLAQGCAVTRDFVEITCVTAAGVGGRLLWVVTVDGQQSVNPTTAYRPPVISRLGIVLDSGLVAFDQDSLATVSTAGGQVGSWDFCVSSTLGSHSISFTAVQGVDRVGEVKHKKVGTHACLVGAGSGHCRVPVVAASKLACVAPVG